MMEAIGQGLQCSLNFINKGTIWEDSSSFEFLSVCSLAYLPSLWTQWNMPTLFLRCAHCVHICSGVFGIDHLMFLLYLLLHLGFSEWLQMWLAIQSRQQCQIKVHLGGPHLSIWLSFYKPRVLVAVQSLDSFYLENKLMLSFLGSMLFQISHPSPCWICFMHIQQLIKPKLFFSEPLCTFVLNGALSFLDVGSLFFTALSCSRWVLFLLLIWFWQGFIII